MSVTLAGPTNKIQLTMTGFFRLRRDIAGMIDKKFGEHYSELITAYYDTAVSREKRFSDWDKEASDMITDILKRNTGYKHLSDVFDFLLAPDCNGIESWECAAEIRNIIDTAQVCDKDEFLNEEYGREDDSKGANFLHIVKECSDSHTPLEWY